MNTKTRQYKTMWAKGRQDFVQNYTDKKKNKTKQNSSDENRTEHNTRKQDKIEQYKTKQDTIRRNNTKPDQTRHTKTPSQFNQKDQVGKQTQSNQQTKPTNY